MQAGTTAAEKAAGVQTGPVPLARRAPGTAAIPSASGPAGGYLLRHGLAQPGRIMLEQGYEMLRPSQIEVGLTVTDGTLSRLTVGGGVVLVAEGHLLA